MIPKLLLCLALLLGGIAVCGAGLWLLLRPPQYAATVRIKIAGDSEDYLPNSGGVFYDPYFFNTTFEIMQSTLILSNVVAGSNLKKIWGKKHSNGEPLKYAECYEIIKKHVRFMHVRNTKFDDITYYSSDLKEAADVANAIAEGYQKFRDQSLKEMAASGLPIWQQAYQDQEKQILVLQTNVEQLRQEFTIQNDASNNQPPEQRPYWDEKNNWIGGRNTINFLPRKSRC